MEQLKEMLRQCQETLNAGKMKKYKLVKPYPNSLEVGTEVTWGNHGLNGECYETRVKSGIFRFSKETIENNPEFWQEVKQLDYEILTFSDSVYKSVLYKKQSNGKYGARGFTVEDCLLKYGNSIHTVKRLSDGLILTVGDTIVTKNPQTVKTITGFKVSDVRNSLKKGLWATVEKGGMHLDYIKEIRKPILVTEDGVPVYSYYTGQHWVVNGSYEYCLGLCKANVDLVRTSPNKYKVFSTEAAAREYVRKTTPLFVTEDEVKIFEGDTYFYVDPNFTVEESKAEPGNGQIEDRKYFSTKEAVKKYLNNCPRLSIQDCLNIRDDWYTNKLGLEESIREYLNKHGK